MFFVVFGVFIVAVVVLIVLTIRFAFRRDAERRAARAAAPKTD